MKKIAIIGAGISGLYIANLFKNSLNYEITIYEKNDTINLEDGYGIQLSVNSVKLLNKIGFNKLSDNEKFNPEKIDFFSMNSSNKICDLDITNFNTDDIKYTTLKRSTLINFLKKDLGNIIKTGFKISKINDQEKQIKISFENNVTKECDYLIIADGVFSKSKNLISNHKVKPKYNYGIQPVKKGSKQLLKRIIRVPTAFCLFMTALKKERSIILRIGSDR